MPASQIFPQRYFSFTDRGVDWVSNMHKSRSLLQESDEEVGVRPYFHVLRSVRYTIRLDNKEGGALGFAMKSITAEKS